MKNRFFNINGRNHKVVLLGGAHSGLREFESRLHSDLQVSITEESDYQISLSKLPHERQHHYKFIPSNGKRATSFQLHFEPVDFFQEEKEKNSDTVSLAHYLQAQRASFAIVVINIEEVGFLGPGGQMQFYYDELRKKKLTPVFLIVNLKKLIGAPIKAWCIDREQDLTAFLYLRLKLSEQLPNELLAQESLKFQAFLAEFNRFFVQNKMSLKYPYLRAHFKMKFGGLDQIATRSLMQDVFQTVVTKDIFNRYIFDNLNLPFE